MSITAETLAARSKQQQAMTQLIGKLKAATQRVDNIVTLGCKTETEALEQAARHLSKATDNEIIGAMKRLEQCKLKTYDSIKVPGIYPAPYAGIPDTLKGISKADLATWLDKCKKTTFSSGNKYQPLPTHDEGWQIYVGIFQDAHVLKQHANNLRTHVAPRFTDTEVINAAKWGFWHSMTIQLRRRAYGLLPKEVKESIKKDHKGNPEGASEAVREYYDELCDEVK
jgi:hypothetical protein